VDLFSAWRRLVSPYAVGTSSSNAAEAIAAMAARRAEREAVSRFLLERAATPLGAEPTGPPGIPTAV
jgi:hypothetical protein